MAIPIVARAISTRDKLARRYAPQHDVHDRVRRLFVRKRRGDGDISYVEILPTPIVTDLEPSSGENVGRTRVSGNVDSFRVTGVSKRYARSYLQSNDTDYVVGGTLENGVVVGGTSCELTLLMPKTLTWEMTLKNRSTESRYSNF